MRSNPILRVAVSAATTSITTSHSSTHHTLVIMNCKMTTSAASWTAARKIAVSGAKPCRDLACHSSQVATAAIRMQTAPMRVILSQSVNAILSCARALSVLLGCGPLTPQTATTPVNSGERIRATNNDKH